MRSTHAWGWMLLTLTACDGAFLHKIKTAPPPNDSTPALPTCDLTTAATITSATWSSAGITLTWTYEGQVSASFTIYSRDASDSGSSFASAGTVASAVRQFIDTEPICADLDRHCQYYVSASEIAGCEPAVSSRADAYSKPNPLQGVSATLDGTSGAVDLSGTDANERVPVDHVVIERLDVAAGGDYVVVDNESAANGAPFSYRDATALDEHTYRYRVSVVATSVAQAVASDPVTASPDVHTCPAPVTSVAAVRQDHSRVRVSWVGDAAVGKSCRVRREGLDVSGALACDLGQLDDAGLTPGTTYGYTVVTESGTCARSAPSSPVTATPAALPHPSFGSATLDAACLLTVPGSPGLDSSAPNPPSFASATGSISTSVDVVADAGGLSGTVAPTGASLHLSWTVVDDQLNGSGPGSGTVADDIALVRIQTTVLNPRSVSAGQLENDMATGRQVWFGTPPAATGCRTPAGLRRGSLAMGPTFACVLEEGGKVSCWGDGTNMHLGSDLGGAVRPTPIAVNAVPVAEVIQVAAGVGHACALVKVVPATNPPSRVYCWGNNSDYEVSPGSSLPALDPTYVGAGDGAVAIAAGASTTCVVDPNVEGGVVRCWGSTGVERGNPTASPVADSLVCAWYGSGCVGDLNSVTGVVLGFGHGCAISSGGTLHCWGDNSFGQLGNGSTLTQAGAVSIVIPGAVVGLALGFGHTCALTSAGEVWCWGDGTHGQLGLGDMAGRLAPTRVTAVGDVIAIAAGSEHTCALRGDGLVSCWGRGDLGQLGVGGTADVPMAGTPVMALEGAVAIQAGGDTSCALTVAADSTHRVVCWGDDSFGQTGSGWGGTGMRAPTPQAVCLTSGAPGSSCPAAQVYPSAAARVINDTGL